MHVAYYSVVRRHRPRHAVSEDLPNLCRHCGALDMDGLDYCSSCGKKKKHEQCLNDSYSRVEMVEALNYNFGRRVGDWVNFLLPVSRYTHEVYEEYELLIEETFDYENQDVESGVC